MKKYGMRLVLAILLSALIIFLLRNLILDWFYPSGMKRETLASAIMLISAYWVTSSVIIALLIPNAILRWFSGVIIFSYEMFMQISWLYVVGVIIFVFGITFWFLTAMLLRPYLVISTIIHTLRTS